MQPNFTPEFYKWFGKSLVVDANGNPLRVYHGSNKPDNISVFKSDHSYGYYFTDNPEYAADYSGTTNIGSKTIPVYLKLERPMDFYAFRDLCRASRKDNSNPVEKAMKLGFDGVITSKKHEFNWDDSWGPVAYDPKTYIVFSPKQIKSAIGNKGSYNPEDERITEAAKPDVMLNPAFKTWFKNSKVVDQNGKPLPVYHGTKNDFDAFHLDFAGSNNDPGMWGTGFYFSPQIRMSKGYGNKFKRCYLSLQNPLIFGDNHGDIPKELNAVLNRPWSPHFKLTKETANAIRDKMISMGYDGVMQYSNSWKYPAQIVAFYPSQIKLVNGNKGTYDPQNDRIDEIAVRNLPKINWDLAGLDRWNPEITVPDYVPLNKIHASQKYRSNKIVAQYMEKMKAGEPIDPIWVDPDYTPGEYSIARGTFGGHHRMWALRKLGYTDQLIPVMVHNQNYRKGWTEQVNEELIEKTPTSVIEEIIRQSNQTPYDINDGYCRDVAVKIAAEVPQVSVYVGITHTFVEYRGKFYDIEVPDGVSKPENLPIYNGNKKEVSDDAPEKISGSNFLKRYGKSFTEFKESIDYRQVSSEKISESSDTITPKVLYHGTTEKNAQNILTKGLILNYSKFGSKEICASDNKELALRWATQRTKELLDWEPEKCLPDVNISLFAIDGSYFRKSSDGIYISTKSVPASALLQLETYKLGDLPKYPLSSNEWTEPSPTKIVKLNNAVSESKELFTFMTESKAFRNEAMVEKYTTKELSEILFAMMLTVHLMDGRDQMKQYCRSSLKFPKFDHIFLSSTDLSNVISTLRNAKEYLGQQNVDIPVNELKQYLRGIVLGKNTGAFSRAFFMKLQQRLRIKNADLLILRRQIVDGDGHHRDDISSGRPLYEILRKYRDKSDILVVLQLLMDGPLSESVQPKGDCFKDSYSAILYGKAPGMKQSLDDMEDVKLVHGLVDLNNGRRGNHAWIEFRAGQYNFVWEPQSKRVINKDDYYKSVHAEVVSSYSQNQAMGNAVRSGHSGPWTEKPKIEELSMFEELSSLKSTT